MSSKNGQRYEFGDFRLDSEPPSLWRDESVVPLPPKALELLLLLVREHERIVSREQLLETVWRDTFVEEGNINYTVSLLRKTLDKDDKGRFIQTVPKRGYRFLPQVVPVDDNGNGSLKDPQVPPDDIAAGNDGDLVGTQEIEGALSKRLAHVVPARPRWRAWIPGAMPIVSVFRFTIASTSEAPTRCAVLHSAISRRGILMANRSAVVRWPGSPPS